MVAEWYFKMKTVVVSLHNCWLDLSHGGQRKGDQLEASEVLPNAHCTLLGIRRSVSESPVLLQHVTQQSSYRPVDLFGYLSRYFIPNPTLSVTAAQSFSSRIFLLLYRSNASMLKHVLAVGNLAL